MVAIFHLFYKSRFSTDEQCAVELILSSENDWQVKLKNEQVHHAVLGDSLFVHPLLTIILLKYNACAKYYIFTPENIEADLFRRLRVRLRFNSADG